MCARRSLPRSGRARPRPGRHGGPSAPAPEDGVHLGGPGQPRGADRARVAGLSRRARGRVPHRAALHASRRCISIPSATAIACRRTPTHCSHASKPIPISMQRRSAIHCCSGAASTRAGVRSRARVRRGVREAAGCVAGRHMEGPVKSGYGVHLVRISRAGRRRHACARAERAAPSSANGATRNAWPRAKRSIAAFSRNTR